MNVQSELDTYFKQTLLAEQGQEWSWYHCYNFFLSLRNKSLKSGDYDLLCLHLAFYLASCDLYRGSSFLLQNDYKVHRPAIEVLLAPKYDDLVGISSHELLVEKQQHLLSELVVELRAVYTEIRTKTYLTMAKSLPKSQVSDALITKVILATLGCVPGFDDPFKKGMKHFMLSPRSFSQRSIIQLATFYQDNNQALNKLKKQMARLDYQATEMKVLDSLFRQIGQKE